MIRLAVRADNLRLDIGVHQGNQRGPVERLDSSRGSLVPDEAIEMVQIARELNKPDIANRISAGMGVRNEEEQHKENCREKRRCLGNHT